MPVIWDYDINELKKTKQGKLFILQRLINYGLTDKGDTISLKEVKDNWDEIKDNLYRKNRMLMELLIWGKYHSLPKSKNLFSIK